MADALSIEETNRIRVSLGMKPLPVPGGPVFQESDASFDSDEEPSTLESREAQGTENWRKLKEEAERKRQKEARHEAIKKARDKAKRFEKLQGKSLGDADDDELDTRTWLLQQKKRQKKLDKERARARKMEEELRQREEQEYTSKDLAGVKVGHQASEFDLSNGEHILTLKDATIDEYEEEGDELENVELREQERLKERNDILKKKPAYDPNADDQDSENRTVLNQYDEVIDGKKRKRFTLNVDGMALDTVAGAQLTNNGTKGQAISLDVLRDFNSSDYQEPKEVTFKKPKKSKKKSTRQKAFDDDDLPLSSNGALNINGNGDDMEIDGASSLKSQHPVTDIIDDDDLQASLALARRAALKKRNKTSAKEFAQQLKQEDPATAQLEDARDETGLVINETSEFVTNLKTEEIEQQPQNRSDSPVNINKYESPDVEGKGDVDMDQSDNEDRDPTEVAEESKTRTEELTETGLDADTQLTQGLGSTLTMLRQRGLVEQGSPADLTAHYRNQQRFLMEKRRREEAAELRARQQRERDRASGKLDRMSAREREDHARWENKQRDQFESRQAAEMFNREYKPNVDIKHIDEHGRRMGPKDAFKSLSHQFHGKGSGKQKTEKHLKKIQEEKDRTAQSVLSSGPTTGLNSALGSAAKKNKQAGVRLA